MNGNRRAENHNRNAQNYLQEVERAYTISPTTGLYEPKSGQHSQTAQKYPPAEVKRPPANRAEIVGAVFSGFGVFISVLTLVGLVLTVAFTKGQWQESHRSASAAILAAKSAQEQLIETTQATRDATETERLTKMPVLGPEGLGVGLIVKERGQRFVRITLGYSNSGQTRATRPIMNWGWSFGPPREPLRYIRRFTAYTKATVVPTGAKLTDDVDLPMEQAMSDYKDHGLLYVYGHITYGDVFPYSAREGNHRTDFCFYFRRLEMQAFTVKAEDLYPCPKHNCHDDACYK